MSTPKYIERPATLISSSSDLAIVRTTLKNRLEAEMRARGHVIEAFVYEEHEQSGAFADARNPVQRQIDDILQGRVMLTLVMFGEKVGFPLQGEVPAAARDVLEEWRPDGLIHPWPTELNARNALLKEGHFPLTGTTYELLVALTGDENIVGKCIVGYVANTSIGPDRELANDIAFNRGLWLQNEVPVRDGNMEDMARRTAFVNGEYAHQRHGLFNLIRALARRGKAVQRFDSQEAMAERLINDAVRAMMRNLPDQSGQLPFKRIMECYDHGDPLPLPDRLEKRAQLRTALVECGANGEMLALEGPSGCGKSSLLRKGLLDDLPFNMLGSNLVLFRPNELMEREERTPFLKLCGMIAETLISAGCGDLTRLGAGGGGDAKALAVASAERIEKALLAQNARLVVAIDQFEDVIDHAELEQGAIGKPRSWWQVLRMLDALAMRRNIWVVGTLESQRLSRVESLSLHQRTGLRVRPVNVDFPVGGVSDFVRHAAANARLPLSGELVVKIQSMVEDFEAHRRRAEESPTNASFLPLLGLWLARLFEIFQDRSGDTGRSASRAMRDTDLITEEDLAERGIGLQFSGLIAELMDAAWDESGIVELQTVGHQLAITDRKKLDGYLEQDDHPNDIAQIIGASRKADGSVNLQAFFARIGGAAQNLPGIGIRKITKRVPQKSTLDNFLSMFVGIDRAGSPRLLTGPATSPLEGQSVILSVLRRRRLLVSAGPGRVQLVHQAVIDKWPPGRSWFQDARQILQVRRRMQARYEEFRDNADDQGADGPKRPIDSSPAIVADAALLLLQNRATWPEHSSSPLDQYDLGLRDFCLDVICVAQDGAFDYSGDSIEGTRHLVHVAAMYDRAEAIERWSNANPSILELRERPFGNTPLGRAAWSGPKAVDTLLRLGSKPRTPDDEGWHPIAASFQHRDTHVFDSLIGYYKSATDVVGPNGQTLLSIAAGVVNPVFLERLIDKADNIDVRDEFGQTPS